MHKKLIIIFYVMFCQYAVFAQKYNIERNSFKIKGQVFDDNNQTIEFASIGIINTAIGTVSNQQGFFELNISQKYLNDTLAIFSTGYDAFKIVLNSAVDKKDFKVLLKPIAKTINEIVITDSSPLQILQKALKNIGIKYSKKSYVAQAFYTEIITENNDCNKLTEAAINVFEPGYKKARNRNFNNIAKIHKVKRYDDFRKYNNYKFDGLNYLLKENIFGFDPSGILSAYKITDWEFLHTNTTKVNNEIAYEITFSPKKTNLKRPTGKVYIAQKDYAILQLNWNLNNCINDWQKEVLNDANFLKYTFWQMSFNYKRLKGKLYLNYIKHQRKFDLFNSNNLKLSEVILSNELIVNNIFKLNISEFINTKNTNNFESVFKNSKLENDKYWSKYNLPTPTQKLKTFYKNLNEKREKSQ